MTERAVQDNHGSRHLQGGSQLHAEARMCHVDQRHFDALISHRAAHAGLLLLFRGDPLNAASSPVRGGKGQSTGDVRGRGLRPW